MSGTELHAIAGLLGADPSLCFTVTVDGNPVPKGRPRFSKQGHAYTPQKTEQAEAVIAWTCKAGRPPRIAGPVVVATVFYCKDRRRTDLDNLVKTVLDAGTQAGLWVDDSQVTAQVALLEVDREHPRTEIVWAPRVSGC